MRGQHFTLQFFGFKESYQVSFNLTQFSFE
ncbi:Uncharacterised protein [Vibrio cholerae]|nr:Uncharacterised protein [Vibrio cholerae]